MENLTFTPTAPQWLVVSLEGRELLRLGADGTVLAPDIEAANEAGRVFVESLREQLSNMLAGGS
jgi:hypothetical protein